MRENMGAGNTAGYLGGELTKLDDAE